MASSGPRRAFDLVKLVYCMNIGLLTDYHLD